MSLRWLTLTAVALTPLIVSSVKSQAATNDSLSYTYYPDGRLKTVTYLNGTVIAYAYDNAGNRQAVTTSCPSGKC